MFFSLVAQFLNMVSVTIFLTLLTCRQTTVIPIDFRQLLSNLYMKGSYQSTGPVKQL